MLREPPVHVTQTILLRDKWAGGVGWRRQGRGWVVSCVRKMSGFRQAVCWWLLALGRAHLRLHYYGERKAARLGMGYWDYTEGRRKRQPLLLRASS